jgi:hypothetical protein
MRPSKNKKKNKDEEWRKALDAFGESENPSLGAESYALMSSLGKNRTFPLPEEMEGPIPIEQSALYEPKREAAATNTNDREACLFFLFSP